MTCNQSARVYKGIEFLVKEDSDGAGWYYQGLGSHIDIWMSGYAAEREAYNAAIQAIDRLEIDSLRTQIDSIEMSITHTQLLSTSGGCELRIYLKRNDRVETHVLSAPSNELAAMGRAQQDIQEILGQRLTVFQPSQMLFLIRVESGAQIVIENGQH